MLITTIQKHPLLSLLTYKVEKNNENYILGLHATKLSINENQELYIIGVKELQEVFKTLCREKNIKGIKIFLDFDYQKLTSLEEANPFSIKDSPLNQKLILDKIQEANYFEHKEVSLLLQKYLEKWIIEQIHDNTKEVLHDDICDAFSAVATYSPKLIFDRLNSILKDYQLTKERYDHPNYRTLLNILEEMATSSEYFEYAAKQLLYFAETETRLGVYHGEYKALHHLKSLFRNSGAKTEVTLETRKNYLENFLQAASNNYYQLYCLIKILGMAADYEEMGEHTRDTDPFFENYIHFCIEKLMQYAGIDDENGLCLTAEEELHSILQMTIDEPEIWGASDIPFLIFRFFLELKREWNANPFYHISALEKTIQDLKKEKFDTEYVSMLELRLQQLISLIANREFVSSDFHLCLSSKYEQKFCDIDTQVEPVSGLELHERQSLAERLIFKGKSSLEDTQRGWPKCTYIVANFGMIISEKPDNELSQHKRIFKTLSINVPEFTVTGRQNSYGGHAEEAFYNHLLVESNILHYLAEFKKIAGIKEPNHKVYAVILDLHGTYDMCLSCSQKGLEFQNQFREKLLHAFQISELATLKKYPTQLPIVIRYSADLHYDYTNATDNKKKGLLSLLYKQGKQRDLSQELATLEDKSRKDIKNYGANLLIHGKANWHTFWSKPRCTKYANKTISLEAWSAFVSDHQLNTLSEEERKLQYTQSGYVETTTLKDVEQGIKKLELQ